MSSVKLILRVRRASDIRVFENSLLVSYSILSFRMCVPVPIVIPLHETSEEFSTREVIRIVDMVVVQFA